MRSGTRALRPLITAALLAAAWLGGAGGPARAQPSSSDSNPGYIDNAIPGNLFRFRFEAAYNINRSDRAEFIYARGADPRIDYQDFAEYFELAATPRLSGFVELHEHLVNPTLAPNDGGLGDTQAGFKFAFLFDDDRVATFQLRTYIPTGSATRILGTGHVSLEPGLLLWRRLSERLIFEGELKDWVPIGGTDDFAGNVTRYGAGLSYRVVDRPRWSLAPVVEFVGWTVLSGQETVVTPACTMAGDCPVQGAAGDTIVNVKAGARLRFGESENGNSLYFGYGRALTGDVWYKDLLRVEFRLAF